jgi:hypothetical protein
MMPASPSNIFAQRHTLLLQALARRTESAATMNLDSYIRLNPYFDDEKLSEGQDKRRGGGHTTLIGCIVLAMVIVGAWMWTRSLP